MKKTVIILLLLGAAQCHGMSKKNQKDVKNIKLNIESEALTQIRDFFNINVHYNEQEKLDFKALKRPSKEVTDKLAQLCITKEIAPNFIVRRLIGSFWLIYYTSRQNNHEKYTNYTEKIRNLAKNKKLAQTKYEKLVTMPDKEQDPMSKEEWSIKLEKYSKNIALNNQLIKKLQNNYLDPLVKGAIEALEQPST